MKEIKTKQYKISHSDDRGDGLFMNDEGHNSYDFEVCLEDCNDVCDTVDCREDCETSCEEDFGPDADYNQDRFASAEEWIGYGKYLLKNDEAFRKQASRLGYIKEAAMPGWKDIARIPQAIGRGVYETLGGYDPMERYEGLGSSAVSTDLKDKLMQIYNMISSDPAIVNAVPRLGTAMKDMSTFVAQQQAAAKQQEESIAMARYRRQKTQEDLASGKLKHRGMEESNTPMADVPSQGNQMYDQMNAIEQQNQG